MAPSFQMLEHETRDRLAAKNTEIDRLRAELAKAHEGANILAGYVNLHRDRQLKAEAELAAMCENHQAAVAHYRKRDAELAEARRALLAGNDTVLANKKLQEDNAAKDARIAEVVSAFDGMSALCTTLRERVAELAEANDHLHNLCAEKHARAERTEAKRYELRELLDWIYGFLAYVDSYHSRMIRDKVRAALNRSPPD